MIYDGRPLFYWYAIRHPAFHVTQNIGKVFAYFISTTVTPISWYDRKYLFYASDYRTWKDAVEIIEVELDRPVSTVDPEEYYIARREEALRREF